MRLFFLFIAFLFAHSVQAEDERYASIDAHALVAPSEAEATLERLAAYLTGPAQSDAEKVRAIYRWVTDRIDYDVNAYFSNTLRPTGAAEVLARRSSACSGYATLFEALGKAAGLEVVSIGGYAKGYGFVAGSRLDIPNHAWNAVRIDGRWRLVDPTWGAGYVRNGRFFRAFSERYFLASPEEFMFTHLPENDAWQLQTTPHLTKADFESLPLPGTAFFNLGISGKAAWETIRAAGFEGEFARTFDTPDHLVNVKQAPLGRRLTVGQSQHWAVESQVFEKMALVYKDRWISMKKNAASFEANFSPDEQGELILFGKKPGTHTYVAVLGYVVD